MTLCNLFPSLIQTILVVYIVVVLLIVCPIITKIHDFAKSRRASLLSQSRISPVCFYCRKTQDFEDIPVQVPTLTLQPELQFRI